MILENLSLTHTHTPGTRDLQQSYTVEEQSIHCLGLRFMCFSVCSAPLYCWAPPPGILTPLLDIAESYAKRWGGG